MNNGKDRLDRIEKLLEKTAETGQMVSLQTAENAKQIAENAKQIAQTNQQLSRMAKEHDREMKELRGLFKQVMRRLTI